MNGHIPVLKREVLENLLTQKGGIYVDGTVGCGGHAAEVLSNLEEGSKLIGLDCDPEATAIAKKRLARFDGKVGVYCWEFQKLKKLLSKLGVDKVDGILLDLGISSFQLDSPHRGFSYRYNGPLDMRMNPAKGKNAFKVINTYAKRKLTRIFSKYGEERLASKVADAIFHQRVKRNINTTLELRNIVESVLPREKSQKSLSRIFQAIRIEVNDELKNLEEGLKVCISLLRGGGRICVISYHSLEDRLVKSIFKEASKDCICPPHFPVCVCSKQRTLRLISRGALFPSEEEKRENKRARSARMRVAEKVGN